RKRPDHLRLRRRRTDEAPRQSGIGCELSRTPERRCRGSIALDRRSRHQESLRARRLGGWVTLFHLLPHVPRHPEVRAPARLEGWAACTFASHPSRFAEEARTSG